MGTPAFPDLGKHCSFDRCKQIDFLPFTCDRCDQVYCLEHRSYREHQCPHGDNQGVTVVICPLCAKGVRLIPDEDPNITWESHVNTVCDPQNYEKVTKKRKCPVIGCKEILVFSNTVKCKDCSTDHCLKHRFGPDHKCPGPPKSNIGFPFMGLLTSNSRKEVTRPNQAPVKSTSSAWSRFVDAAEAGMSKLSNDFSQVLQVGQGSNSSTSTGEPGGQEMCPQCNARFSSVTKLVEHVQKVHERSNNRVGVRKSTIDACPKCSRGFTDPVALVKHVEKDHGGTSRA
ncbi:zinc finger AN1 and C2H2 domain-containing stress-associated protein 11 [Spinacia oleracea]|uniref:Zinc finger AN1 and C2H2 domain-containing stress-associated protein 11 n=1 Tax=Spinacia oleracea TaxID=3562 RepID=A0A9R0JTH9_SPIOL|nr:zinc finger AN1 and C2H2 domain-containing stress-associated protein 11-like [Spinacia oleracea]